MRENIERERRGQEAMIRESRANGNMSGDTEHDTAGGSNGRSSNNNNGGGGGGGVAQRSRMQQQHPVGLSKR